MKPFVLEGNLSKVDPGHTIVDGFTGNAVGIVTQIQNGKINLGPSTIIHYHEGLMQRFFILPSLEDSYSGPQWFTVRTGKKLNFDTRIAFGGIQSVTMTRYGHQMFKSPIRRGWYYNPYTDGFHRVVDVKHPTSAELLNVDCIATVILSTGKGAMDVPGASLGHMIPVLLVDGKYELDLRWWVSTSPNEQHITTVR